MIRTLDAPCYSFRSPTVSAALKIALKLPKNLAWPVLSPWSCYTEAAAWLFTAERCLSAPPRRGSAAPAPGPSTPGQLEPEAGSYSLAPGCLVRRRGQPPLNHGSAIAFLQKGLSKRKGKAILTSDLPPHPPVECSF